MPKKAKKKIKAKRTKVLTCPYCGYQMPEAIEEYDQSEGYNRCWDCEKVFWLDYEINFIYTSSKLSKEEQANHEDVY